MIGFLTFIGAMLLIFFTICIFSIWIENFELAMKNMRKSNIKQDRRINMTELTEQERLAINAFLSERWDSFCRTAENYLSQDQIDDLSGKLEGDK